MPISVIAYHSDTPNLMTIQTIEDRDVGGELWDEIVAQSARSLMRAYFHRECENNCEVMEELQLSGDYLVTLDVIVVALSESGYTSYDVQFSDDTLANAEVRVIQRGELKDAPTGLPDFVHNM